MYTRTDMQLIRISIIARRELSIDILSKQIKHQWIIFSYFEGSSFHNHWVLIFGALYENFKYKNFLDAI